MGRKLSFQDDSGTEFTAEIDKLKRDELYGWSQIDAFDENDNKCFLVSVADDGKTLFGDGGYAFADINENGDFIDSKEITAVDSENNPLNIYESSFNTGINLAKTAAAEDLLSHQVKSVYQMTIADGLPKTIQKNLAKGILYQFDFSYRGGTSCDQGFLLENTVGEPFLFLTSPSNIQYLTFTDASAIDDTEDEDSDIFDFAAL